MGGPGKLKIVDGQLLVLATLRRKMAADGNKISRTHLTRIFNGERNPSIGMLEAISKALDLSLDETWAMIKRVRENLYWHPIG